MANMNKTELYAQALEKVNKQIAFLESKMRQLEKGSAEYYAIQKKITAQQTKGAKVAKELAENTSRLSVNNKNHTKAIQTADAALKRYNATLKQNEAGVKGASNATKEAKTNVTGFVDSFKNGKIGSTLGTVIRFSGVAVALGAVLKGLKFITTDAIGVFTNLEQQFANIRAVVGLTSKEFKPLEKAIMETAGTTVFTATEISQLVLSLSKLGLSSTEVTQAIQPIAFAAQALGEDLAKVGESVVKVINEFGLSTAQTSSIADTLVAAVNRSALSFETFNTAIQYVGPLAAQAGLSFQETAAAMGVLADNGFSASRIGTGMRQILLELGATSENLFDQLELLAEQNIGVAEAMELVGARAAGQLLVLTANTEEIKKNADAFNNQGVAAKAAAEASDTFQGQTKILNSALEELQYSIGENITATGLLTELIGLISDKGKEASLAMRAFSSDLIGAADITNAVQAIYEGANSYDQAVKIFTQANVSLSESLTTQAWDAMRALFTRGSILPWSVSADMADYAAERNKDAIKGIEDALKNMEKQARNQIQVTEGAKEITDKYSASVQALRNQFRKGVDVDKPVVALEKELRQALFDVNTELLSGNKLTDERKNQLEGMKQGYNSLLSALSGLYKSEEDQRNVQKEYDEAKRKALDAYRDELALRKEDAKLMKERVENEKANARELGNTADLEQAIVDAVQNRTASYEELQAQLDNLFKKKYISKTEYDTMTLQLKAQFVVDKAEIDQFARDIAKIQEDQIGKVDILSLSDDQYESLKIRTIEKTLKVLKDTYNLTNEELNKLQPLLEIMMFGDSDAARQKDLEKKAKDAAKDAEDAAKKAAEDLKDVLKQAAGAMNDIIDEYADVNYENLKRRMDAELELIQQRYDTEEDILKSQLDSNLISQSQYENQLIAIQKRRIAEENKVDKAIFDAEKKRDKADATSDFLEATAMAFINEIMAGVPFPQNLGKSLLTTAIAGAKYGAQMNAISMRKFYPKKFAEGGLVYGPSHAEGGVPFRVAGQGGYEMEGGEFIVNKQATARHYQLLQAINGKNVNYTKGQMSFATGGIVVPKGADESTMLLKQIADASILTSINSARPVRAYVSSKDLSNDEAARKTRERNKLI